MNFLNWTRILRWLLVVIVIAVAAQAGRLLHSQMKNRIEAPAGAAAVRRPIPYTVTLRETFHGPNGTSTDVLEQTYAVRSDGSRLLGWRGKGSQRVMYLASGFQVDTNDKNNTKSSMRLRNANAAAMLRDPDSKCLLSMAGSPITSPSDDVFVGEETVAGYRTAKIAAGIITSWYALEYGCALIKSRWEFSATEVSEKELVALVPGEPDPSLFDVPAH